MYVNVIVDITAGNLDRHFQYHVPEAMEEDVHTGCCVQIPFGKGNRAMKGFVVGMTDQPSYDPDKIKNIKAVDKSALTTDGQLIALAEWIRVHHGCTMAQALKTVMPVKKQVREKQSVTYRITDTDRAAVLLEKARKDKRYKARVRFLEAILSRETVDGDTVTGVLQVPKSTIDPLLRDGIVVKETTTLYRGGMSEGMKNWGRVTLNEDQRQVVDDILASISKLKTEWCIHDAVHLLFGITGSGKTEVYMDLMDHVLAEGKQVIVLIPEISLTLQTVSRFYEHFGDRIAVMNSRLSAGEKFDQYMRARNGQASIMIGPRSALFTPFDNLGLIIIDEEHENAYKSETTPKYHAREAAIARARMAGAAVVLGSATPSVTSYEKAKDGIYGLHLLKGRAKEGARLPDVEIIDLREELRMKNRGMLSRSLKEAMAERLAKREQIMLFINRRGYAGFVSCRSCGHVMRCSHCDVSMTEHYGGILKCHYCGDQKPMPKLCPSCGSPFIASFGVGTQKVESFVKKEFPDATILRMDKDTTSGKEDMAAILRTFAEGGADILIGTQMIVKGHDFENVTLVGILAADLSMFTGDYLSAERTFQLLTQAAGRAGRGDKSGKVIIQTYQPDHYCIRTAAMQDYEAFYDEEICFRKMMHYPPVTQMLQLLIEGKDRKEAEEAAQTMKSILEEGDFEDLEILGPTAGGITKVKDFYRFVLYMKHQDENELIRARAFLEGYLDWSGKYKNLYFNYDLNPAMTV